MGLRQKESFSEDMEIERCCADCKTTKTPLWRGGPAGPKSLCNACGIRYRKRRSGIVGLSRGAGKKERQSNSGTATSTVSTATLASEDSGLSESVKLRLMDLGKEVLLQRSPPLLSSPVKRQRSRRKLGEEEQAAVLLMAMSCGSVFA